MRDFAEQQSIAASVLLVTNKLQPSPAGGREMLCKLNCDVLTDLYGGRLMMVELEKKPVRGIAASIKAFRGYVDGLSEDTCAHVFEIIASRRVDQVFIDGSNLGKLAKLLARRFPRVQITVFFHNVEARFFWGAFKRSKSIHALAVFMANYLAERMAVRHADKLVCLSNRDSRLLSAWYGREATHISPMALRDSLPRLSGGSRERTKENFLLFVGGNFYANRDGIAWFVDHVVPRISIKTVVVGNGLEALKDRLQRNGNVAVVGTVDSLGGWYRDALVVIAPIFDGSGMKTKVAEALMYGKKVIGTPEAFSGYESVIDNAGWVCSTPQEFVDAILSVQGSRPSFMPELRLLYEQNYSFDAARSRLSEILETAAQ